MGLHKANYQGLGQSLRLRYLFHLRRIYYSAYLWWVWYAEVFSNCARILGHDSCNIITVNLVRNETSVTLYVSKVNPLCKMSVVWVSIPTVIEPTTSANFKELFLDRNPLCGMSENNRGRTGSVTLPDLFLFFLQIAMSCSIFSRILLCTPRGHYSRPSVPCRYRIKIVTRSRNATWFYWVASTTFHTTVWWTNRQKFYINIGRGR